LEKKTVAHVFFYQQTKWQVPLKLTRNFVVPIQTQVKVSDLTIYWHCHLS